MNTQLATLSITDFSACLQPRKTDSHKGDHGSAGIIGGASGMLGAALLAARSALLLGAGRVFVGLLDKHAPTYDGYTPELMLRHPNQMLACPLTALAVGPGLGTSDFAQEQLVAALTSPLPLVLDADALNLLASQAALLEHLRQRAAATVLTPHPAEAARLLGISTERVQADRAAALGSLTALTHCHVVLKGAGSLLGSPTDSCIFKNPSGNPGLAAAGMGDVLTGMICALLAQGHPTEAALRCGVYLHGAAADRLVSQGVGPIGLTASEVSLAARSVFNAWTQCPNS